MVILIKDAKDLKTRLSEAGEKLVVIVFMAAWCKLCKKIEPKLEELADERVVVLKVDVDESEEIAAEYNVKFMPTYIILKNSKKERQRSNVPINWIKNDILGLL